MSILRWFLKANPLRGGVKSAIQAKQIIQAEDFGAYAANAVQKNLLQPHETGEAIQQYQQFLLLVWANERQRERTMVVPTEKADVIWHEHILFTKHYEVFSRKLIGGMIHHHPGLEKGTAAFDAAVAYTRSLQRKCGSTDSFAPLYLGACGAGIGFAAFGGQDDSAGGAGGGSSDGSSCGSSCGGGGCGGGCGS